MNIHVRFHQLQRSAALHKYAETRIRECLSKFSHQLEHVAVRFVDTNGPRGGEDKRCKVTTHSSILGSTTLSEQSTCAYRAVDLSIKRLARTLRRRVARSRRYRNNKPLHAAVSA